MSGLSNKYEDIEMLVIPDDEEEVSVSSETEIVTSENDESEQAEASTSCNDSRSTIFTSNTEYPDLDEWLSSSKPLEFHFNSKEYKKTINITDEFQKKYVKYTISNYKVLERLTKDETIMYEIENDVNDTIGVITNSSNSRKSIKIDESFQDVIENLQILITNEPDDEAQNLEFLKYILLCLYSSKFYHNVNRKPELIKEWVNNFDPQPTPELAEDIMINNPSPYLHPQFWNTLLSKFIIRGCFDQCHSVIENSNYQELQEKCVELYEAISDLSSLLIDYTNFSKKGHFAQWKLLACEFRDSLSEIKNNVSEPTHRVIFTQIYDLACIITGLPKTIASHCDTWYEIYLTLSLYQIRDNEEIYEDFFQMAVREIPPVISANSDDLEDLSETCFLDILKGNYLRVLELMFKLDQFTAAYISEFLELKLLFKNYYITDLKNTDQFNLSHLASRKTISEYFLTRHAFESLSIHDLVPVAIGLLLNEVVNTSKNALENHKKLIGIYLPNFYCKTNDDLEWCLTICADLNLISTARELYYNSGVKSLEDGYLYEALNSFVKCFDPEENNVSINTANITGMKKVHYIIWELIFSTSLVENKPIQDDLINNIIDKKVDFPIHPVIQQCLSPYGVLKEFFDSLSNKQVNVSQKLSKLIHLLRFNFLPKKFHPLLLAQLLLFVNDDSPHLQFPDLIVIIELIDNFEAESNEQELQDGEALYLYSINNLNDISEYDWRQTKYIPQNVKSLINYLRGKIGFKIGELFIE